MRLDVGTHLGLDRPRRTLAAGALWIALIAVSIELMSMSVVLPAISRDFGISPADATWVVKAYQLSILLSLLPLSALGEVVGYRRVYQAGLGLYSAAAICCLLAPSPVLLICARALQGLGVAGIVSVNGALVRYVFPHDRLTRAFATNSVIVAVFGALGPSLASAAIAIGSWRWLFALSTPLCLLSLFLGWQSLPENPTTGRFQGMNAGLYAGTIASLFTGSEAVRLGWPRGIAIALFGGACICAVTLIRRSLKLTRPLVPVDLLRGRLFQLSILTSIGAFAAQTMAFVALPFQLIFAMHLSQVEIGPLLMSWPIAVAVAAPLAGNLAGRISTATLAGFGLAVMAAGLMGIAFLPVNAGPANIVWRLAMCGFGFGFFQSPNNHLVLTSAPMDRAGAAAGMQAIARHIGQISGASMVAALFTFSAGGPAALAIGAGIAAAGAFLSLSRKLVAGAHPIRPA
jgi:DHA2 family multidrug resistance protein-like MFS transporter